MSIDMEEILRQLYGDPPTTRPEPGDLATIDGLTGLFTVASFNGALFTLRSEHGATCKAGVLVVRALEQQEAA